MESTKSSHHNLVDRCRHHNLPARNNAEEVIKIHIATLALTDRSPTKSFLLSIVAYCWWRIEPTTTTTPSVMMMGKVMMMMMMRYQNLLVPVGPERTGLERERTKRSIDVKRPDKPR